MAKFLLHGTVIQEPARTTFSKGVECIRLVVEERYATAVKEVVNVFSIDFIGKLTACVPTNMRLAGAPVVVTGKMTAREYKGKHYYDLNGEQLSIIATNSFIKDQTFTQADIDEVKDETVPMGLSDDDLPF